MIPVKLPKLCEFDYRDPATNPLYPFPLPNGIRALISVNTETRAATVVTESGDDLTGWCSELEEAAVTVAAKTLEESMGASPELCLDSVIYDRGHGGGGGGGEYVKRSVADFLDDDWPALRGMVAALVLASVPADAASIGADTVSLWSRRMMLQRGLIRAGAGNPYRNPQPIIRHTTLAPETWDQPSFGCAARSGERLDRQIRNCFRHGYAGCLVMDVNRPWNVSDNIYQLITEDNYL